MVLLFAGHNLVEVLAAFELVYGDSFEQLFRWYYAVLTLALTSIVAYSFEVSRFGPRLGTYFIGLTLCAVPMSLIILFTDLIVSGTASIGYTMTAIKGEYYWTWVLYATACNLMALSLLVRGYRGSNDNLTQIRCGYTLLAITPLILTALAVLVLMLSGYLISAYAVLPVVTTLFLLITLASERAHGITDIRRHIPFSLERRTSQKIMKIFSKYSNDTISYRDALNEIETLLVTHKHTKKGRVVSYTAAAMEVPRSTLYSIINRLGIELKERKD